MKTKINLFLSVFLCFSPLLAKAQQAELITDRPDQTESATTVPHKTLQIETGFVFEEQGSTKNWAYNTTLLRYGITPNFEWRLGLEYLGEENQNVFNKGLSPLYTGFKIKILEEQNWIPELAFLGGLNWPFAADNYFAPTHPAASMRFALAYTLSDRYSLGLNMGPEWDGNSTIPAYFYSMALGVNVFDNLGIFLELYGNIIENNNSEHLFDSGFTYLLSPTFQVDISGGLGLNNNALDAFFSFGMTYRLPH